MSVVDAGVVCKLLFEEEGSEDAQRLLDETTLAAPDLIYAEVGNVIWKRVRFAALTVGEAERAVAAVVQIPLLIADSRVLLPDALAIGVKHGSSLYDSLYVALAITRGEQLVTTDARLVNRLYESGLSGRARLLR